MEDTQLWFAALEHATRTTLANIERFGDRYPHVSRDDHYELKENAGWTCGFWPGLLWLSYEHTRDVAYLDAAKRCTESFRRRLDGEVGLRNHDIGFLYTLSALAHWRAEGDESAKRLALEAADRLLARWSPVTGVLQAWGPMEHPEYAGKMIIDCLMNLPLLYAASRLTGHEAYEIAAYSHARKSLKYLLRGDNSSYHTFTFDPSSGDPLRGATHQGFADGSTWTRGQAWGIYGFALSFFYTRDSQLLSASVRMADYFLERLPGDAVVYWDFDAPVTDTTPRDSSASAIAVCGLLELSSLLDEADPRRTRYEGAARDITRSMVERYSTIREPDAEGLLRHGSYSVRGGAATDDYMIWGDYYYMEALMRLARGHSGYTRIDSREGTIA
jgi:unsaturated chondroitin disaccharide hydrolase